MYRALYRAYRPESFADVVGQEAITTALQNQIIAGKIGHAFMFTGTRGTGKTTCAKIFAKAVNCENRQGANPCGECAPCKGLEDGSILDVIEIDAASNNGVDDIRDLRDETAYRPSRCNYKVYIIDEVHMLSTAAFNALLKIMEEPPSHVIFILATTEIHKVPATILSRCQRYDFIRIPAEKIAARLQFVAEQEGITLAPEAADLIARLADGALRDALSLLDTCAGSGDTIDEDLVRRMAGVADKGYLFEVSDAVAAGDPGALLALLADLREKSIDVKRLAEELVHHYRNIMLAAASADGSLLQSLPAEERAKYAGAAKSVDGGFAITAVRRLAEAMDKMGRSPDPRIELELALFDLSAPPATAPAAAPPAAPPKPAAMAAATPQPVAPAPVAAPAPAQTPAPVATSQPPAAAATPPEEEPTPPTGSDLPPWETQAAGDNPAEEPASPNEAQAAALADSAPPWETGAAGDSPGEEPSSPAEAQAAALSDSAPPWETQAVGDNPAEEPASPAEAQAAAVAASAPPAAEEAPAPVAAPETEPVPAPEPAPAPEGTPPVFAEWPQVVEHMKTVDRMLFSYMRDSHAYLEGSRVLIDGGDMFLSYMREYPDAGEKIKEAIAGITGKRYAIGPYTGPAKAEKKQITAQDTLQDWQQKGVEVEYTKE